MSAASEIQYVWFVIELLRSRKRNRERDASRTAEMERQKARNKKTKFQSICGDDAVRDSAASIYPLCSNASARRHHQIWK